jgi:hypothetical protein
VALAKRNGKSVSEMERELGITPGLLAKWKGVKKSFVPLLALRHIS